MIVEGEPTAYDSDIVAYSKSNNLNIPWASLAELQTLYPVPSAAFPSAFNASSQIWRDAHMQCLAHNLATERTRALGLPVWRYRFDLIANNLNSRGTRIGAFHGEDIRFVMGQWGLIVLSPPFVPATPDEIQVSNIMVDAWTNFIKGTCCVLEQQTVGDLVLIIDLSDPLKGPQTAGWKKYDPTDTTTLGLLGNSLTGAIPGDHLTADSTCSYWNTVLPIFPQVRLYSRAKSVTLPLISKFRLQTFPACGSWTC